MTKCIVIGEKEISKKLKPIELRIGLDTDLKLEEDCNSFPEDWKYAELICRGYTKGNDLIFLYDDPRKREEGVLFIGNWNDGIV
jgi:hypothetical protein